MSDHSEMIKKRVIRFKHGKDDIAGRAARLLEAVGGVTATGIVDTDKLSVEYDIRVLSLQMIEAALADVGFDLSDSMMCRIKRDLIAYVEDNQRETLHADEAEDEQEQHEHVESSAHDPRPWHWRNYS